MRISDWSSDVCSSDLWRSSTSRNVPDLTLGTWREGMRLLIVGTLDGHIVTAGKLALESGAKVAHVDDIASALTALRSGPGADMVMVEVNLDLATIGKATCREGVCQYG